VQKKSEKFFIPMTTTENLFQRMLEKPLVMGILNVTPDSFFDGGKYTKEAEILKRAEQILAEGAEIIDIGGYSSRPSATDISENEELDRLKPAIELIQKHFSDTIFSVDTFRAGIAKFLAENYGVQIINDISGGTLDDKMFDTVSSLKNVIYILMHLRGTPKTMQNAENTLYNNVTNDVFDFFEKKISELNRLNISRIIVDLGFGFAKTVEQNFELLRDLQKFTTFGLPILAGMSRKTMLWKTLQCEPKDCLNATTVVNTMALMNGAKILRVHDVKEAVECVKIVEMIKR
jgi:dihydropteroate synthase